MTIPDQEEIDSWFEDQKNTLLEEFEKGLAQGDKLARQEYSAKLKALIAEYNIKVKESLSGKGESFWEKLKKKARSQFSR